MGAIQPILLIKLCILLLFVIVAILFCILWRASRNIRNTFQKRKKELSDEKIDPWADHEIVGFLSPKQMMDLISDAFIDLCRVGEVGFIISVVAVFLSIVSLFL